MIVGPVFDGDQDHALRQLQQRQIGRAVGIVLSEARARWQNAEALLDVKTPLGVAIDTLDPGLDLIDDGVEYLAAIWRLESGFTHPRLEIEDGDRPEAILPVWYAWLRAWIVRECPPGVMRAILSCAYEPDERSLPNHGYLVRWLRDDLARRKRARGI